LCARITAERYTLLHIVGHGRFKQDDGQTILYLADQENKVDPVTGTRLLDRLKQVRGARGLPHFLFLSSCESAVAEAGEALGGLAQRLVSELGLPAVLAMTEKVSIATAQALAEGFYRRLREHGEPDRALVESCAGLAGRHDINVPALYSRLGVRPLFTDALDRPLTKAEIDHGLTRGSKELERRAPVLLSKFEKQAMILRGTLGADAAGLSKAARENREMALTEANNLCAEALDLSFHALALGQEPPAYDERCPFRGLYPFRVEDREFFFGRETLVARLLERLAETSFLAVLGPSGSGKSSLVLAGLVPALQAQENNLPFAYLTPGSDPLDFLEAILQANDQASLLVVDQFEELFTLCTDDAKRRAFLSRLLQLPEQMRVVLMMRADFWGECAPYSDLKDLMQARQELIASMDATELRRAMEQQAARVGLRFEADLSNTILDDVKGEPGAMPLLQHALLELWKRRHGRWLRAEEYRAIGGVKKAIAETAEAVYRDLSSPDQERVRDIFVRLTRLDEEATKAEERRDTRQRVRLHELTRAGSDTAQTKTLVKRLADARLMVTSMNAATGREEVEVAHEALMRYWPRLRRWLDEDQADLRVLAMVRLAAQEWHKNQADESLLTHHGARLSEAERLLSHPRLGLNREEAEYLGACRTRQERQAQRERRYRRSIVGVSVGGTIIALMLAALAWYQRGQALDQKEAAEDAKIETQTTLAKELFRPLARQQGGFTPSEVSALAALAGLSEAQQRVRVFFIERALADSESARRFAHRYPAAVQATVGLNQGLAEQAAEALRQKLQDPEESIRTAAALAIGELDLADPELRGLASGALVEALRIGRAESVVAKEELVRNLLQVVGDLPPSQAASHRGRAAELLAEALAKEPELLAEALAKEPDPWHWKVLAHPLAEVCKAMPPEWAAHLDPAARLLVQAMGKETDWYNLAEFAHALADVSKALPRERAATHLDLAAELLAGAMAKEANSKAYLAHALADVCKALPPDRAATHLDRACKLLVEALAKETEGNAREFLCRVLLEVCEALPAERAATHLDSAAKLLAETLQEAKPAARAGLAHALAQVCEALPAERAATHRDSGAKLVADALANEPFGQEDLARALAHVCKGMPPDRAAKYLDPAAKLLVGALANEPFGQEDLARALAYACKGMPPDRAAKYLDPAAKLLVGALAKETDGNRRENLSLALLEVCHDMSPHQADAHVDAAAKLLADALAKEQPFAREVLARALAYACKGLSPKRAAMHLDAAAKFLVEALAKETNSRAREELLRVLFEVCKAMPPGQAATDLYPAAKLFSEAIAIEPDSTRRAAVAAKFAMVYERSPADRKRIPYVLTGSTRRAVLAAKLAVVYKQLPADKAIPYLLTGLPQYPETQETFLRSLSGVAGRCLLPDVVESLKHPLCYGDARQIFLQQAEQLTGQQFKTRWEMVDWLTKNHPEISLSTPPEGLE
jgi:hypothetical protein